MFTLTKNLKSGLIAGGIGFIVVFGFYKYISYLNDTIDNYKIELNSVKNENEQLKIRNEYLIAAQIVDDRTQANINRDIKQSDDNLWSILSKTDQEIQALEKIIVQVPVTDTAALTRLNTEISMKRLDSLWDYYCLVKPMDAGCPK